MEQKWVFNHLTYKKYSIWWSKLFYPCVNTWWNQHWLQVKPMQLRSQSNPDMHIWMLIFVDSSSWQLLKHCQIRPLMNNNFLKSSHRLSVRLRFGLSLQSLQMTPPPVTVIHTHYSTAAVRYSKGVNTQITILLVGNIKYAGYYWNKGFHISVNFVFICQKLWHPVTTIETTSLAPVLESRPCFSGL